MSKWDDIVQAMHERGEANRKLASERRTRALEFYESADAIRFIDVGAEMGVGEHYAGEMIRRAKLEREHRNRHKVRRIYG